MGAVVAALLVAHLTANAPGSESPDGPEPSAAGASSPLADAPVTLLNDNGAWSWFQDERAIFTRDGRLMVTSVADRTGTDGEARDGGTEVTSLDLRTDATWTDVVRKGLASDDHNAAALLELPERTLALATSHSSDPNIYQANLEEEGLGWVPDPPMLRPEAAAYDGALGRNSGVTYSNLAFLAQENDGRGRVYNIFRSAGETLHLITSDDQGRTWTNRGRIFTPFRAYIRMVSDGQKRISFVITNGHPANFDGTSLYGGYIEDDAIHRPDGTRLATLGDPVDPVDLSLVFSGTAARADRQTDAWGSDIALDANGNPVVTFSTTVPGHPRREFRYRRHEARYARWDGTAWQQRLMGDAGAEVGDQVHYTGLSTIDPSDPDRVFLSTDSHPATGELLRSAADGKVHHEIYEGRTTDGGATWTWTAVTRDSREDNVRPIVPNPRDGNWALIWMRGSYRSGLEFDTEVIAIVNPDGPGAQPAAPDRPSRPPWGVPSTTPIASDLDGDGHDDLTFFAPGTAPDMQVSFLAGNRRRTVYRRQDAPDSTRPVSGDFDGDGRADIVWYQPDQISRMWWTSPTGNPVNVGVRPPPGTHEPVAGDFDGDGRADILWHQTGPGDDLIWWGRADRTFSTTSVSTPDLDRPLVGDLDGDGRDDLIWVGSGTSPGRLWWAERERRFSSQPTDIGAELTGAVGDVDGDGRDEVIGHAGSNSGRRWDFEGDRSHRSRDFQVDGSPEPVIGDFDDDGRDDLLWSTPSTGALEFVWGGTSFLGP